VRTAGGGGKQIGHVGVRDFRHSDVHLDEEETK
jgi:hypothetical protein